VLIFQSTQELVVLILPLLAVLLGLCVHELLVSLLLAEHFRSICVFSTHSVLSRSSKATHFSAVMCLASVQPLVKFSLPALL
jgi:hypothetical protein